MQSYSICSVSTITKYGYLGDAQQLFRNRYLPLQKPQGTGLGTLPYPLAIAKRYVYDS